MGGTCQHTTMFTGKPVPVGGQPWASIPCVSCSHLGHSGGDQEWPGPRWPLALRGPWCQKLCLDRLDQPDREEPRRRRDKAMKCSVGRAGPGAPERPKPEAERKQRHGATEESSREEGKEVGWLQKF